MIFLKMAIFINVWKLFDLIMFFNFFPEASFGTVLEVSSTFVTIRNRDMIIDKANRYNRCRNEIISLHFTHLAEFKDSNKNISTAVFRSELQKLESEYSLQQNILISLASEYNNNKIKLNKDTPIFSVLDEVSLPNEKYKPKRTLIVLIYTFIGFIISTFYILTNEKIIKIIQIVKTN